MGIIYICRNKLNSRVYIGQTIRSLTERVLEHKKELRNRVKSGLWLDDYLKVGIDNFEFSILEKDVNNNTLSDLENSYILEYNSLEPNGYNKKLGSSNLSTKIRDSKYGLSIDYAFADIINSTYISNTDISNKHSIPLHVVDDIIKGTYSKYLKEKYPEDYILLEKIQDSLLNRQSFFQKEKIIIAFSLILEKDKTREEISNITGLSIFQVHDIARGKTHKWLYGEFGIEYTKWLNSLKEKNSKKEFKLLNKVTGQIHIGHSPSEAARALNLDHRRISELVSKKRNSYLDWVRIDN